ncbi:hypothetical protein [Endozoicomonas montiporae]|uniref:hypothetical protein n=1 Tax=Endozoicomonas montiporae TaxID=1027273 RepID=UPI001C9D9C96|nr:hypothetical protein [Endozoicomonas montiporae]
MQIASSPLLAASRPSAAALKSTAVAAITPTATSTAFVSATTALLNPCDRLRDDEKARNICNHFFKTPGASVNPEEFSHAFVVSSSHVDYRPDKQLASSRIVSSQTTAATPSPGATSSTVKAAPSTHVSPDVSVGSITPARLPVSVTASVSPALAKTKPCNDIRTHTTAFAACKAFLENKTASAGHTFSTAVVVNNAKELDDAVTGKFLSGSAKTSKLIVLKSGTYQLTRTLYIRDKIALVGTVEDGEYPVIEIDAGNFKSNKNSLAHLYHDSTVVESGFYSHHIHWNTTNHKGTTLQLFMGAIDSQSYEGELRIYENKFSEARPGLTSHYILLLNAIGGAVIENNRFDTGYLTYTPVLVTCLSDICETAKPGLEVLDNHFHSNIPITNNQLRSKYSIVVRGYMRFGIIGNRQETKEAAGNIYITDHKNEKNIDGYVLNNIAHKNAPELQRRILFRSFHSPEESVKITGKLHVAGNDYYTLKEYGLSSNHVDYRAGKQLASASAALARFTPSVTPSPPVLATATVNSCGTPMPSRIGKMRSSPPIISSPCDQLTCSEAQVCQKLTDDLQKLEIQTTFSEAVMVKNSQELINEITTTSESGKVILLHAGSYALDEPLHILKTVALVGIGNAVVKPSANYPAEAGALVLLDDAGTGHGFFTRDMTWDISAFGDSQGDPLSTAVKAVNYEGKLLMSGNDFQYHANRENEKAPYHYIEVQNSSGDVLISGNNFFSGGLQRAPIYASCQGCRTDDQTIGIFSNHFTDSNDGESALTAIDVRHYKTLNVHGNVQDTESASAGINIELPNHTDAINAIIKDNIAIGTSDETRRTIDLTVARLANEAARIDGTVEVSNNRCFSVNHNGIPSHVLGLIQGSCPISPAARAHIGEQSSSGISAGEGVGYTVAAAFGTYTILLLSSGAYSRFSLPGHEYVYNKIFLRLAGPVLWLYSNTFGSKGHKPKNNQEENELKFLDRPVATENDCFF